MEATKLTAMLSIILAQCIASEGFVENIKRLISGLGK